MNTSFRIARLCLVVSCLCGLSTAWGQMGGGGGFGGAADANLNARELSAVCQLTQEQQIKVAKIQETQERDVAFKHMAMDKANQALQDSYKTRDNNLVAAATKQYTDAGAAWAKANDKLREDLLAVLTDKQKAAWMEHELLQRLKVSHPCVNFTDEQLKKIKESYRELTEDKSVEPGAVLSKLNSAIYDIMTPQQRSRRLAGLRHGWLIRVLALNDEQVGKLAKVEETRAKAMNDLQTKLSANQGDTQKALQEAQAAGDKQAIEKIQKEIAKVMEAAEGLNKKFDEQAQTVLTPQQKAMLTKLNQGRPYSSSGAGVSGGGSGGMGIVGPGN